IQCVFPNRARVPRAKQTASKTRDTELLRRISRLESLVSKIGAVDTMEDVHGEGDRIAGRISDPANLTTSIPGDVANGGAQSSRLDEKDVAFVKLQETGRP